MRRESRTCQNEQFYSKDEGGNVALHVPCRDPPLSRFQHGRRGRAEPSFAHSLLSYPEAQLSKVMQGAVQATHPPFFAVCRRRRFCS